MNMVGVPYRKEHLEEGERNGEVGTRIVPAQHPSHPLPSHQNSSTEAGTGDALFIKAHIHTGT